MSEYRNADRAAQIYEGLQVEDGRPYLPANGTEGEIFTEHWCNKCQHDQFLQSGKTCPILMNGLMGVQPREWLYVSNGPVCTAFDSRELIYG